MFNYRSLQKAPKGTGGKGRRLPARTLAYELAVAVLRLSLAEKPIPIYRESVQGVSPVLTAAYTKPQSTIPTYFGQGRSGDGLGLHRPGGGAYPVCRENAGLALLRLEELGHSPAMVAAILGTTEQKLLAGVEALPTYADVLAQTLPAPAPAHATQSPLAAPPVAPVATVAPPGPSAPTPAQARRDAKKAAEEAAKEAELAGIAAFTAQQQAEREALMNEEPSPEVADLLSRLTDDDMDQPEPKVGDL